MAYIFDPIRNTFVDDEDTSLGNKLALNDTSEEIIRQIDEQFGPGTVFPASELPPKENPYKDFEDRNSAADGGMIGGGVIQGEDYGDRTGFANPVSTITPEVEKFILQLRKKYKIGAEAISKQLELPVNPENPLEGGLGIKISRAPIGKRLAKLLKEGKIKPIPYAERAAAINQRGEFYGLPASEKYLKIREVRDIDRTTRFKDTGKLKYNIPANAKFKIDFKNPGAALVSEIPDNLQGVQYYKTKAAAQKALDKRNSLVLTQPADPDAPATKASIKRRKLLKRNAPFNFSAFGDFEFHHIMNIGGPIALDTSDVAIVSKSMNKKLAPYNKRLNNIGEEIFDLIETRPKDYLKKIKEQNKKGKAIVTEVKQKLPKEYRKLIGFNEVVPIFDDNKNVQGFKGKKFGGSKIKNGILLADLSKNEIKGLKKQMVSDLNKFQSSGLKDKILSGTGKILKGVGKVIKPVGYAIGANAVAQAIGLAEERGIELTNLDKFMALDSGDPEIAINNAMRRMDPEFAASERAKDLAQMSDDFEEVGLDEVKPDETLNQFLADGGRVGFNGGGAVGADEDFAKELEYFLLNPDAELPKADSYRETMNPVALLNDMIDPRNYAYYADRLAETGVRIGEFGARVLPALGQLTADLIQRPAFKVTGGSGQGYVQDYTDVMPSNIKGTGIFTDFLNNLVGTEGTKVITEKTGLADLIRSEEQKQKDRRSTVGPKILADQVTLGAELTAPIFPGLKLLKAYAKNRKLPVNDTTKEVMEKEIDEVLSTQNLTRRDFLKATGAGGAVILAKMLGFGDELATTTKVAEKVAKDTVGGTYPPPYFFKLVDKIKFMGDDVTEKAATKDREVVKRYKEYEMSEDVATGEITIVKRNEGSFYDQDGILSEEYIIYKPGMADETTKGTPPPEYEEFTVRPDSDGKLKDSEDGLDSLEEILEEVGDPDSLTLKK